MKLKHILIIIMAVMLCAASAFSADKKITLASLNWEPYAGPNLPQRGFTTEIVVEAFKKAGYEVKVEFHPWAEGLALAKEGKLDGIYPASYTKARDEYFIFSESFADSPIGLYKKTATGTGVPHVGPSQKKADNIVFPIDPRIDQSEALQGLQHYKFGVVKGYNNSPEFDAATFLDKVEADNDEENFKSLFKDEVQLIMIDKYVAKNILVKKYPWYVNDFVFMEPPLQIQPLYVAFSKKSRNHEQQLRDFNSGLNLMEKDGQIADIKRRYGF